MKPIKRSGVLVFSKGSGIFSKIVMWIEGDSCSHVSLIYKDLFLEKWRVAEMLLKGLVSTDIDVWFESHKHLIVACAEPIDYTDEQRKKLNIIVTEDVLTGVEYDVGGLFAFIWKYFVFLNNPKKFFCSEFISSVYKATGFDPINESAALESPQDWYNQIGKSLRLV